MNLIKQGILMAITAFIFSMLFSYFMDGNINWILSFGIVSGFLLGTLLMYLLKKEERRQRGSGD
ncbi:hypothetical protein ANME2D_01129 [Candidatus Methanoperedens nitroreducens]|uniref:Uncharacterized protein n=1 Tax=Candidatus Methanoperedens nitratireducens TaxID=1392998 RepID=A0A062V7Z1_9EURY|nr:hypothetical protein [Candidatus Methanoperedens nitroreducens]KCZ72698.1 hypothetical protein ANME2D_01129 [Candidatus Methanoperedens nitroreducens]MDJ1423369.1 hypothetical protein [Candidatus Methanoperedens sp.]